MSEEKSNKTKTWRWCDTRWRGDKNCCEFPKPGLDCDPGIPAPGDVFVFTETVWYCDIEIEKSWILKIEISNQTQKLRYPANSYLILSIWKYRLPITEFDNFKKVEARALAPPGPGADHRWGSAAAPWRTPRWPPAAASAPPQWAPRTGGWARSAGAGPGVQLTSSPGPVTRSGWRWSWPGTPWSPGSSPRAATRGDRG